MAAGKELADARVELHEGLIGAWESGEGVVVDTSRGAMEEREEERRGWWGFEVSRTGVDFGGLSRERVLAGISGLRRWWEVPGRARTEVGVLC